MITTMLSLLLYLVLQFSGVDQDPKQQDQMQTTQQVVKPKPIDGDWEDGD